MEADIKGLEQIREGQDHKLDFFNIEKDLTIFHHNRSELSESVRAMKQLKLDNRWEEIWQKIRHKKLVAKEQKVRDMKAKIIWL